MNLLLNLSFCDFPLSRFQLQTRLSVCVGTCRLVLETTPTPPIAPGAPCTVDEEVGVWRGRWVLCYLGKFIDWVVPVLLF